MFLSFLDARSNRQAGTHGPWLLLAAPAFCAMSAQCQTQPRLAVDMSVVTSPDPFLLSGNNVGAMMAQVSVSPGVKMTSPRGSTLDVGGTITDRRYNRLYGNYVLGEARMAGRYRDSDFLSIGAAAGFERSLAIDILSASADVASDPRGIRNDWYAQADAAWRPDPYSLIAPEIRYERIAYADSPMLRNADVLTMGVAYARRTDPLTSLGLRLRDTVNAQAGLGSINSAAIYATLKRQLGQHSSLIAELGAERTGGGGQSAGTLLAGRVDLCREDKEKSRRLTGCLTATLNSQISGFGGLRRDATVILSLRQPMGEHFVLRANSEYRRSARIGPALSQAPSGIGQDGATDAMRHTLMLDWAVDRHVTLSGTIQYLQRQLVSGQRIGAAFFGIQLHYQLGAHP
ncbi:hypothetical protein FHW96_002620 [Novosphingobium sp. SG751A]|uniref:hypothetical protein n=1 Tax=Novosphingobium sp. SG751A TaxID=2587000 RepID=UPI001553952B|nr:hypothetical protein [Novosphingobium sp. SG751A]NOW46460.1 hypothetical protein [Novosphingobium sp. SG751A]